MNKLQARSKRQTLLINQQDFIKVNRKDEGFTRYTSQTLKYSRRDELDEEHVER